MQAFCNANYTAKTLRSFQFHMHACVDLEVEEQQVRLEVDTLDTRGAQTP